MTRPLRIAFPVVDSRAWSGGFYFMLNLCRALVNYAGDQIEVVAFFGEDAAPDDVAAFSSKPGIEVCLHHAFSHRGQGARLARSLLTGLDRKAAEAFTALRIDIVFESARFYGVGLQPAAIAWFPDFQHRRLPHLFGRLAWWKRELGFRMQLRYGRTIIVSSEDAGQDCENYYGVSRERVNVLSFPAIVEEHEINADPAAVVAKHDLPEHFIYLPNQFWQHKNHALVIEALGILKQRNTPVTVVSTGHSVDPRKPELFDEFQARLASLDASDAFRSLGVVPRTHVIALIRTCSALLNPSLCEGWNTGVEEAKLFKTPMLLSDLAVHREQAEGQAHFFSPNDAETLANLLFFAVSGSESPGSPRALSADAADRTKKYAKSFVAIAEKAWKTNHK